MMLNNHVSVNEDGLAGVMTAQQGSRLGEVFEI
jgi:hypothetical protein